MCQPIGTLLRNNNDSTSRNPSRTSCDSCQRTIVSFFLGALAFSSIPRMGVIRLPEFSRSAAYWQLPSPSTPSQDPEQVNSWPPSRFLCDLHTVQMSIKWIGIALLMPATAITMPERRSTDCDTYHHHHRKIITIPPTISWRRFSAFWCCSSNWSILDCARSTTWNNYNTTQIKMLGFSSPFLFLDVFC